MIEILWHAGWVGVFAWMTYTTARTVLHRPPLEGRIKKFHDYFLRPFGAVLTFVCAGLTVGTAIGLIQLTLR